MAWWNKIAETATAISSSTFAAVAQPAQPAHPASELVSETDKALDAVAAILRTYGKHAFDTDELEATDIERQCEEWATRLLVGPARGQETDADADGELPGVAIKRDWPGVRRFLSETRKHEGDYVKSSLGNLRQAIQTFAQCLTATVGADRKNDARVQTKLGGLDEALRVNDTQRIRAEALGVVDTVREVMSERRRREDRHIKLLGDRLRTLRHELNEVREQASIDALTRLCNRAAFDRHLERLADLGLLFGHPPCLILIDLDHFKGINDKHGHPSGDEVLRQVADTLMRTFLRKEDFVARYGGEEFAVVLVDTTMDSAKLLCERLLTSVRAMKVRTHGFEITPTVSLGVATLRAGESHADWLERTDKLLYQAKELGRDRMALETLEQSAA